MPIRLLLCTTPLPPVQPQQGCAPPDAESGALEGPLPDQTGKAGPLGWQWPPLLLLLLLGLRSPQA